MSAECLVDKSQLRGLPYETVKLFGMPHIGAWYKSENVIDYGHDEYVPCACCGRPASNVHHEPPRGTSSCKDPRTGKKIPGSFLLFTPWGRFVLLPALICLCGTGTMGCHGDRTENRTKIRWEWDSDEEERKWWDGTYLKDGLAPGGAWLYRHGRYVFETPRGTFEYRDLP